MPNTLITLLVLIVTLLGCEAPVDSTQFVNYEEDMAQRRKSWAQSGDLYTGTRGKGISMQTDFENPSVHTVQFNLTQPAQQANLRARARAEITWNVNGNQVYRQVHISDGTSITGLASSVNVAVFDDSEWGGSPAPFPRVKYVASIAVAAGTRASIYPPIYEGPIMELLTAAPDNEYSFDIPDNAGIQAFQVLNNRSGVPDGLLLVEQRDFTQQLAICDPRRLDWITLVPGARRLRVINSIGSTVVAKVIYGIEG